MRSLFSPSLALVALMGVPALSAQTPTDPAMLSPGDSVGITVWKQPDYSGDFLVGPDGTIATPAYRGVKVGGVPLATAESNVKAALLTLYKDDPPFVMEPRLRVSVTGNVPRPLVFGAQPQTSIAEAIARAGGTTKDGDRRRIRVIRSDRTGIQRVFRVNLEDTEDRLSLSPVRSGDQIVVDQKRSFFRDVLMPTIGVVGSVASFGLLIDRIARR